MPRADFVLYVLAGILGRFATDWDQLPMPIPGRADYRVLIGYSAHLGAYAVEGQVTWDGIIELTSLTVDPIDPTAWDEAPPDDDA
jgi:hypothetical protein